MALTFKVTNGDVVVNDSSGRPKLIGNNIGENILSKSKEKTSQDLQGALSIDRIKSGAGAGINELIGVMHQVGFTSTRVLLQRQIAIMFSSLIGLQSVRSSVRPDNERFSKITLFRIVQNSTIKTNFTFRLDVTTDGGGSIIQSGTIVG